MYPTNTARAEGSLLLDPGIRHTNGMALASTEPLRTNSMSWQCNPDNLGYCGGHYYIPCCDSLRRHRLADAARGCYTPREHRRYQWYSGYGGADVSGAMDGIESAGMSTLGRLPNDMLAPGSSPVSPLGPLDGR